MLKNMLKKLISKKGEKGDMEEENIPKVSYGDTSESVKVFTHLYRFRSKNEFYSRWFVFAGKHEWLPVDVYRAIRKEI